MKYLSLLIAIFVLSSCGLFYKTVFGVKNPKIETYHSINKYAGTIGVDSLSLTFAKDSAAYVELGKMFLGFSDILIFNSSKKFIAYKNDSVSCNASIDTVLKRLCNIDTVYMPMHLPRDYYSLISKLDDHNNVLASLDKNKFDFIVFADFAKYFHKVNKNHIPYWNKALKDHYGDCKIKMIYVDLDYLNTWNISKSSVPRIRLSPNKK